MATQASLDFDSEIANFREDVNPKQCAALRLLDSGAIKFLLYGGALGGGKSHFLRFYGLRYLMRLFSEKGLRNVAAMLACEDYPTLKDRQLVKIATQFPSFLGESFTDHKDYGRCFLLHPEYGSGILCFRNLDDPSKYMSAEFALILVDEWSRNQPAMFNDLRTRLRWPGLKNVECQFVGGSNPGGPSHAILKQLFIDKTFPPEFIHPHDVRGQFAFVKALADDNPYADESYITQTLETLPEPLKRAFRWADWNVFVGQAFPDLNERRHAYDPGIRLFPEHSWFGMSFDWGFGAPFSVGWWHTDADGRLYRFASWYGWNGTANQGLRMEDSEIGKGIIEREKGMGLVKDYEDGVWGPNIIRKLSPDCFQKKPDYKGGGQGPSTAEVFMRMGIRGSPGDPKRALKIRQFRERTKIPGDGQMPMMLINRADSHFFRTVSSLITDPNNIEDIDTSGEDHVYDEVALMCMARPLSQILFEPVPREKRPTGATAAAAEELKRIRQELEAIEKGDFEWEGSATGERAMMVSDEW